MTVIKTTAALLALSLVATTAGAQANRQGRAPACNIQSSGSAQVANAYEALNNFAGGEPTAEAGKQLARAVSLVTADPDRAGSEDARKWVLAQSLAAYTLIPGQATIGTRADFGFTSDAQGQVDIILAADSALKAVAEAHPGCQSQIEPLEQMILVAAINEATAKFNGGDPAGAKPLAERILVIEPESPHASHLLANVAITEQRYPDAVALFEKVAAATKDDSTLKELYSTSVQSAGYILNSLAEGATGEEQATLGRRSAEMFQAYLAVNPSDAEAQSGLGKARAFAGDTAAATAMYASMLADPSKYNPIELVNSAVGAANAGRPADAVRLTEAALQSNPYMRDGLFILGTVAVQAEQFDKVIPAAKRLIELDPSNPDNYSLLAAGYQGMLEGTEDRKLQQAYTDSMVRTAQRAQSMPVRVSFTDFLQPSATERVINGSVENLGQTPASYVLKMEFLDAAGNVVATGEQALDAVAPASSKTFSIAAQGQGIVAYRYAPLEAPATP